ncbi:MAG: Tol-Pal system protein TolB [Alphaproteobacteria bacterium]|nr:Tol-Pal system protein TolB [Alphaproteobacteria bacterium]
MTMTNADRADSSGTRLVRFVATALAAFALATSAARAELRIDINKGKVEPLPIAITDFFPATPGEAGLGQEIAQVVAADLERSGLFRPLDKRAFIQTPEQLRNIPRFADWRAINAQGLVTGQIEKQADGSVRAEFRLWDVLAGEQMHGLRLATPASNWRLLAHRIADEIYKRITGEEGYFQTRIVYIGESGPQNRRVKRLAIMDQDGANHKFLTDGRVLVLTPRFSPTTQEITYMAYFNDRPRVYLFNIDTGQQEVLGDFPGMTFAPRFSPEGNRVIMSLAQNGNSDIYTMDLRTRKVTRLTDHPSIDTSPCFAPDGKKIVFNSDRGGTQQLYVMEADGSNVQRISFGDGRYATPVWSPRGDLVAFTKFHQNRFFIGVMRPNGSGERLLTESYLDEAPTWAPNGRVLMFFRQTPGDAQGRGATSRLFSIDLTGFNLREVVTPTDASDPAWSPTTLQ